MQPTWLEILHQFNPDEPMVIQRDKLLASVPPEFRREWACAFEIGWHSLWLSLCRFAEEKDKNRPHKA